MDIDHEEVDCDTCGLPEATGQMREAAASDPDSVEVKIQLRDYTTTPGGRTVATGGDPADVWRDTVVHPALATARRKGETLTIDLDGTAGVPLSFLDEVFGGLVRKYGVTYATFLVRVTLVSDEQPYLISDVHEMIREAEEDAPKCVVCGAPRNSPEGVTCGSPHCTGAEYGDG